MINNIHFTSTSDKVLLYKMSSFCTDFKEKIDRQIKNSETRIIDEFGSLEITVFSSDALNIQNGPISNAVCFDQDTIENYGPYINLILFVKDGYLSELQIYKDDGTKIKNSIDPENIKIL